MIDLLLAAATSAPDPNLPMDWAEHWGTRSCALIKRGVEPAQAFKQVMRGEILTSPKLNKQMVDFAMQWPLRLGRREVEGVMVRQRIKHCPPY